MRRIKFTLLALVAVAALATGGVAKAWEMPSGPAAVMLMSLSTLLLVVTLALAGRIMYVLDRPDRRTGRWS